MFITRRYPLFLFEADEAGIAGQAPSVETPETADTPEGTGTVDNWQERYKEAQAWGTKSAQEAAELRAYKQLVDDWNSDDVDAQKRAAAQLGIQLDEEDPEPAGEYGQMDPKALARLEALEQQFQSQNQTAQQRQAEAEYRADVDPQLKDMGVPEGIMDLVAEAALGLPGIQTPNGLRPDLQGAVKQIEELVLAAVDMPSVQGKVLDAYKKTKRAPHISSSGTAGTQVPNLDKRSDRVAWMTERAQSEMQ